MLRQCKENIHGKFKRGQSIVEYTTVISAVLLIIFAMGPLIKRSSQGMIKMVADQIGLQNNAEQKFDDRGHLHRSYAATRGRTDKRTVDVAGDIDYIYNDETVTNGLTHLNMGFSPIN